MTSIVFYSPFFAFFVIFDIDDDPLSCSSPVTLSSSKRRFLFDVIDALTSSIKYIFSSPLPSPSSVKSIISTAIDFFASSNKELGPIPELDFVALQ